MPPEVQPCYKGWVIDLVVIEECRPSEDELGPSTGQRSLPRSEGYLRDHVHFWRTQTVGRYVTNHQLDQWQAYTWILLLWRNAWWSFLSQLSWGQWFDLGRGVRSPRRPSRCTKSVGYSAGSILSRKAVMSGRGIECWRRDFAHPVPHMGLAYPPCHFIRSRVVIDNFSCVNCAIPVRFAALHICSLRLLEES